MNSQQGNMLISVRGIGCQILGVKENIYSLNSIFFSVLSLTFLRM